MEFWVISLDIMNVLLQSACSSAQAYHPQRECNEDQHGDFRGRKRPGLMVGSEDIDEETRLNYQEEQSVYYKRDFPSAFVCGGFLKKCLGCF